MRNLLVYHIHDKELAEVGRRYLSGRMVDIGCGTKPYRDLLAPFVTEHVGVDRPEPFNETAANDLTGSAIDIPVPNSSFDCAICTAVLEHLPEPAAALKECHRVLKNRGIAIYSTRSTPIRRLRML